MRAPPVADELKAIALREDTPERTASDLRRLAQRLERESLDRLAMTGLWLGLLAVVVAGVLS